MPKLPHGRAFKLAGLLLAAMALWVAPARAQDADSEFRNGVAAFEEGRFEDAEKHFRAVLQSRPSHAQALRYRDEAGYHFWVQVLARGGRLGTVAKRMLAAAEEEAIRQRQDPEKLRADLKNLWSDNFMDEIEAAERLVALFGHYVVPEVAEVLADRRDDEKVVRVIHLLARLGDEATLAVIELLESDDITLQQNAAIALGYSQDVRALPPLKRLMARTQDPHVREAAQASIGRIAGPDFATPEYYARIAEEYYRHNPLFLINRYSEFVVWKWKDNRVNHTVVPRWRWNEEVAEEYCYDGLSVDPENGVLWTLLLSVYAQEWTEIEESLRVAQQIQDRGGELDAAEVEQMKEMQGKLAKAKMLVASRGSDTVLAALGKALADQNAPVAVFMLERLQELDLDPAALAGGGSVTFLTPAPQAPQPVARPAEPSTPPPARPAEPTEKPAEPVKEPEPTRVPDEGEKPTDEGEKPTDEGEKPGEPAKPRRTRRVSQLPTQPAPRNPAIGTRVERLAYRGPASTNNQNALGVAGTTKDHKTGGAAFSAALDHDNDKRVRYAAAIAAAHLNPPVAFPNSDKVMVNLVDALGESGQRVVLVVERDPAHRNRIVGLLRELGYMAFGTETGRDGIARARSFPSEDLILVSSELNPEGQGADPVEVQFIDALADDYRTKPIKIMILSDREEAMKPLVDGGKALDIVPTSIDRATLADKLTKAFGNPADERDEKARSNAIAERAALAIAQLHRHHTQFQIAAAAPALAENVKRESGRPDNVRLACLKAISAIGAQASSACLTVLVTEFKDSVNPVEVRTALATAIGDCVASQPISGDVFQVLKAALQEADESIWKAAGYALGKAKLTGAQAAEVMNEQRLE